MPPEIFFMNPSIPNPSPNCSNRASQPRNLKPGCDRHRHRGRRPQRRRGDQRRPEVRRHRAHRAVPQRRRRDRRRHGDEVKVAPRLLGERFGEPCCRARRPSAMVGDELEEALEKNETSPSAHQRQGEGRLHRRHQGDVRAFLPGSLVDVRPVRDPVYLEGKETGVQAHRSTASATTSSSPAARWSRASSEEREQLLEKLQKTPCR